MNLSSPSRRLCVLLCLGLAVLPARANLGESVAQLVARYGKPTGYSEAGAKTPFGNLFFRAGAYELLVFLFHNQEVGARVSKTDKTAFAEAEIQTIMAAETSGAPWTPTPSDDPSTLQWSRSDQATMMYDKEKHLLLLTSPAMVQAIHAAESKPAAPVPAVPVPAAAPVPIPAPASP